MTANVIQGWFLGGQPKLPPPVPARLPSPIQAKTAARPPGPPVPAFAGRSQPSALPVQPRSVSQPPSPPAPAFAARPPGPPAPAFAGRQGAVQRHGAGGAFAVDSRALGLGAGGGKPLPDAVRGKMEAALGADFSAVRVHVGPQAERIGAIAFTVGSDIYFAPGRFQPDTVHGQQLLGHELAHVVQQRAGRVRNPLGSGLAVVQDHALEAEADRLGRHAARQVTATDIRLVRPATFGYQWRNGADRVTLMDRVRPYPPALQRSGIVQCRQIVNVQVTGLTHLREASKGGSLVRGNDFAEVAFPDTVAIDLDDIWDSRLGMNLDVSETPSHVWYRVVAHQGFPMDRREVYLREGMFRMLGPLTPTEPVLAAARAAVERASKKGQLNKAILYQSLGDVWEELLWPVMRVRRGTRTLYWNLRHGKAELDFVFIGPTSVNIVSAKINRKQYSPGVDKEWWNTIRANWDSAKSAANVERDGPDLRADQLPEVEPVITCESLETQGLGKPEFQTLLGIR